MTRTVKALLAATMLLMVTTPVLAQDKVSLCHATGSESNPYVFITIATPADRNAHVIDENGVLHGDSLGNQDFYADSEEECGPAVSVTPTPSPSPSPSPTPTASPAPVETVDEPTVMPDTATR